MPCSTSERLVAGVLIAAGLAQGGCYYGDPKIAFKASKLDIQPAPPVHVADRLDVTLEGRSLVTRATPLCAGAQAGEYLVVNEAQREQRQSRGKTVAFLLLGAGELTTGYYLWGTDYQLLSVIMLACGSLLAGVNLGSLLTPHETRAELPPERHRAVTLATSGWEPCGKGVPVAAPLTVRVTDGSYRWIVRGTTDADGRFQMPSDIEAWSSSCNIDLGVDVSVASTATDRTVLKERASRANGASLGAQHATDEVLKRHPMSGVQLEIGKEAGAAPRSAYPGRRSWTFRMPRPATEINPPASGGSDLTILARACRQQRKMEADKRAAEARQKCVTPIREGVVAQCRATCVDAGKQRRCEVQRDICVEQTAAVGGGLAQECAVKLDECLTAAGQSPGVVSGCTRKCENEAFDRQCPATVLASTPS